MYKTRKFDKAYILDFRPRTRSVNNKRKEGTIITALEGNNFRLLEILGREDSKFDIGNLISLEKNKQIVMVLGELEYTQISATAISNIPNVVTNIVETYETRFIEYINTSRSLTPRIHSLELIPGIGKAYMKMMLEEREIKKFESYKDIQERVGLYDPVKHITERIVDELAGKGNVKLFVRR